MPTHENPPMIDIAVPVLAVHDIHETTTYWKNVLGFPETWEWGNPPEHGGANWRGTSVHFYRNHELQKFPGENRIWIRTKNIDRIYQLQKDRGANFVQPPEYKPWGFYEYVLQEINGHYLTFAEYRTEKKADMSLPPLVARIVARKPTVEEYLRLARSVGWAAAVDHADITKLIDAAIHMIVAEDIDTNEAIGCIALLGDDVHYYHAKDLMIDPRWQRREVGTSIMKSLMEWIESRRPANAMVSLITSENLTPFYRQFGFQPAYGMIKWVRATDNIIPNEDS